MTKAQRRRPRDARIAIPEAFTRQSRITCNLGHALGASYVPKSFGNERGIAVGLFEACFQISRHFLRGPEVFSNVVLCRNSFFHSNYSISLCHQCGEPRSRSHAERCGWPFHYPMDSRLNPNSE